MVLWFSTYSGSWGARISQATSKLLPFEDVPFIFVFESHLILSVMNHLIPDLNDVLHSSLLRSVPSALFCGKSDPDKKVPQKFDETPILLSVFAPQFSPKRQVDVCFRRYVSIQGRKTTRGIRSIPLFYECKRLGVEFGLNFTFREDL